MHSFISTKTVDSFFCQIIESQVSGDKLERFSAFAVSGFAVCETCCHLEWWN